MAIFGEPTLLHIPIDNYFTHQSSVSLPSDDIICIVGSKHTASIYNAENIQPIKNWKFNQIEPLISPLVYDYLNKKYVFIHSKKVSTSSDDNYEKQEHKLLNPAFCLIQTNDEPIILFQNGCLLKLSQAANEKNSISEVAFIYDKILKVFSCDADAAHLFIFILILKENRQILYRFKFHLKDGIVTENIQISLNSSYNCLCNYIDGTVLGFTNSSKLNIVSNNSEKFLMQLDDFHAISMAFLPPYNIAIVGKNLKTEIYHIQVVNIKYRLSTANLPIDLIPIENSLFVSEKNIYIGCIKGLFIVPYELKSASLATVIGKGAQNLDRTIRTHYDLELQKNLDESSDIKKIGESIKQMRYVSEKSIITSFKALILSKGFSISDPDCVNAIEKLLSQPFNHNIMVSILKEKDLTIEQVIEILKLLIDFLSPEKTYIVDWISAMLDAHFPLMMMSRNEGTKKILNELNEKYDNFIECMDRLHNIKQTVDAIIARKKIQDKTKSISQYNEPYVIEVLKL